MKNWPRFLLLAGLAGSLALHFAAPRIDDYVVHILKTIAVNVILAVSLNLVNGHTGQFSLGHAGFMSVGAFVASGVTISIGAARLEAMGAWAPVAIFVLALAAGGLAAALAGLFVGVPSLRLRGDYLAIVTLGFGEIIRVILENTPAFGGALGLTGIPTLTSVFAAFALAAVTIYIVGALVDSTYGRAFLAVRDDEVAAEAMGINTTKFKVIAFVIGAFFAGIAGGLYAHFNNTIKPEGFNFLKSIDVVVMVILGGMGSTAGVAIAAVLLTVLNEFLREAERYRMIVFALLLIVLMITRPQGLLGRFTGERARSKGQP
ncbi:MAG: branched-chain amino acid ABC transporter permease [Verrucomicrobiota bacterium]|nr:branched-chain amino acid ABC transporter permease [Verrucomicrobiota bacterium]